MHIRVRLMSAVLPEAAENRTSLEVRDAPQAAMDAMVTDTESHEVTQDG
jgi:hypothetical protein